MGNSQIRKRFVSLLAVLRSHSLNGLRIPASETRENLWDSKLKFTCMWGPRGPGSTSRKINRQVLGERKPKPYSNGWQPIWTKRLSASLCLQDYISEDAFQITRQRLSTGLCSLVYKVSGVKQQMSKPWLECLSILPLPQYFTYSFICTSMFLFLFFIYFIFMSV